MATKKATNRKRKFSPAQLRAQRKFAAMARARSKAARKNKRSNPRKKTTYITVNGRKLYGAAAQAVIKKRNSRKSSAKKTTARKSNASKKRGVLLSERNRKKKGIFSSIRSASRRAKGRGRKARSYRGKRVSFWNPWRRRNSATGEKYEEFQGRPSQETLSLPVPTGSPSDLYALGELSEIVTDKETISFEVDEAYLVADKDDNLYIAGDVKFDVNDFLGEIESVSYVTAKDHINPGEVIEYVHEMGEEGGDRPGLITDDEGMLVIVGGDYQITGDGIVN